ncbi:MAG: hypothetical protein KAW52_04055, partial [candidate division Zixibacteria bacterium]|nr:hypothetical protein [candidate division Zixibacteria bacterium]
AGTVPPGDHSYLTLTFDGTLFTECVDETLTCYMVFTTNDCDEPEVSVPVHAFSGRGDICKGHDCKATGGDCVVNIIDVVCLANYIFFDGPAPDPECMADVDRDGDVDSDDAMYLIGYLFGEGPPPEIPTAPMQDQTPIQRK